MSSTLTVQDLIDWARSHAKLAPLVSIGGVANQPALHFANNVMQKILSYPYKWKFNRASATSFLTVSGTEEYTVTNASDSFAFLDRAFIEYEASTSSPKSPRYDLVICRELQRTDFSGMPEKVCVDRWTGASNKDVVLRFDKVPDATIWRVYVDYQQKPTILTATANTFTPIPDDMGKLIRQLFLAEALRFVDDRRAENEFSRAEQTLQEYQQLYDAEAQNTPFMVPQDSLLIG